MIKALDVRVRQLVQGLPARNTNLRIISVVTANEAPRERDQGRPDATEAVTRRDSRKRQAW